MNWIFSLSLILVTVAAWAGDNNCEIGKIDKSAIADRTRRIGFPDGREILLVGHRHGDRGFAKKLRRLIHVDGKSLTNQEFSDQLLLMMDDSIAIMHTNQDLIFLRDLLDTNSKIEFVAEEGARLTIDLDIVALRIYKKELTAELARRGMTMNAQFTDALLLVAGAAPYFLATEPKYSTQVLPEGFESEDAGQADNRAGALLLEARLKLLSSVEEDSEQESRLITVVNAISDALESNYVNYEPGQNQILLGQNLPRLPFAQRELGEAWIRAVLAEFKTRKTRDLIVAKALVEKNLSGILLVGSLHLDSLAAIVRAYCLRKMYVSFK